MIAQLAARAAAEQAAIENARGQVAAHAAAYAAIVAELVTATGSQQRAAEALGITQGRVSQILRRPQVDASSGEAGGSRAPR